MTKGAACDDDVSHAGGLRAYGEYLDCAMLTALTDGNSPALMVNDYPTCFKGSSYIAERSGQVIAILRRGLSRNMNAS